MDRVFKKTNEAVVHRVNGLYGTLVGRDAVILGKGPSLDTWDRVVPDGAVLWAINEAGMLPGIEPDFISMLDGRVIKKYDETGPVISKKTRIITRPHWPIGGMFGDETVLAFEFGDPVPRRQASGGVAIWTLARFGVKRMLLVGFDGMDAPDDGGYAGAVAGLSVEPIQFTGRWARANRSILHAADRNGVELFFWHRGERPGIRSPEAASTPGP